MGPLTNKQGNLTHNTDDICDILQSQYLSVFTTPSTSHHIPDIRDFFTTEQNESHILDNVNITIQDVHLAIKQMPSNAAAGPDGLPSSMFHNCAKELSLPLCIFYKQSLTEGILPPICKSASVIPIYKGGNKSCAANYRPISLTPVLIKIFERILRIAIVNFLDENNLMNNTQHGFRKGRSCISALLEVYDNIMMSFNDPNVHCTDMIYLDFAKAFDKVDHNIILHKLHSIGITGQLGIWLSAFLTKCTQYVQIPGGFV